MSDTPILKKPWRPGPTVSSTKAAEMLGCSESTVRVLCHEGQLKNFRLTGTKFSKFIILRDSVIELAERWRKEAEGEAIPHTGRPVR